MIDSSLLFIAVAIAIITCLSHACTGVNGMYGGQRYVLMKGISLVLEVVICFCTIVHAATVKLG